MKSLILASASPRRAELLRWAGFDFEIDPASIDEHRLAGEHPTAMALRLSRIKALAKARIDSLSLGADTMVFLQNRIFEKPSGPDEAVSHLEALSGRTHQVVTAFALARPQNLIHHQAVISQVTFRQLTRDMIDRYVQTGDGLDKAGAYGLQGLGGFMVETISGSYTGVVGLPLTEVMEALKNLRLISSSSK